MSGARNRLTDVRPIEVSLVDRAAIRRKFLLTKNDVADLEKGQALLTLLNSGIDKLVNDDTSRSEIIGRMARAARITPGTVNEILSGKIDMPPMPRLRGFGTVLGISLSSLESAVEKSFLQGADMLNLAEAMETVLEKSVTGEDKLIAKLEKATPETQNAVKTVARAIESVKSDLPDDVKVELAKSLGVEKGEEKTLDQLVKALDDTAKAELVKSLTDPSAAKDPDLSGLDDATRAEIEKSNKERDDKIVKLEKGAQESRDREAKRDALEKSASMTEGIDIIDAGDFSEKIVEPILKSCPEALPEIERIMKSVGEIAAKNTELLKELGSDAPGANTPAGQKLEKAAQEIMKADSKLTKEQARVQAIKNDQSLADEYRASLQ